MPAYKTFFAVGLLCAASSAQAQWRRFETQHFIIYSESNDKRVTELATGLESIDGLMRMATGLPMGAAPVKVRIYEMGDEGEVQTALGTDNPGVAGFYTSNALGPYAVTLRRAYAAEGDFTPEIVLHHEYAHHFMLQYFPGTYPGWYVEGFAELIGASKTLPDGKIAYGFPAKYRGDEIAFEWVDMRDILLKDPEKTPYDVYGQGWAMTHYLTFSKDRSAQLRHYLEALNAGKSPDEAVKAFGDLAALNREAHAYLSAGHFNYHPVSVPIQQPVIQKVLPVDPGEAALIPETIGFSDFDMKSIRKPADRDREIEHRQTVLAHTRTKAAQYPNDPYALYLLAEVENANGDKQAAETAADRLLSLEPRNVGGMVIKSMLMSDKAASLSGTARAQRALEARHLAMAANQSDPDNPLTYVAFYKSYAAAGVPAPASAVDGLSAAVEKLPSNENVREMLVDELASEGKFADAEFVLSPIANDPHESPLRQAAREKLATLRAKALAKSGSASVKN
jgi:tetratricopeptide (TPR) repeat protein